MGANPKTARVWVRPGKPVLEGVVGFIMGSAGPGGRGPRWRIWHPLDDPECWAQPSLRDALVTASDHFPVTLDIELS